MGKHGSVINSIATFGASELYTSVSGFNTFGVIIKLLQLDQSLYNGDIKILDFQIESNC